MAFDVRSSSDVHHTRIDAAVRALFSAGVALVSSGQRELAFDALEQAGELADSFGHPLLGDINAALATVA